MMFVALWETDGRKIDEWTELDEWKELEKTIDLCEKKIKLASEGLKGVRARGCP